METNKIKQFIKENVIPILVFTLFIMFIALSLDIYPTSTNDEYNESEQDTECIKIISDWDVFYEALTWVESRWDSTAVNPRSGAIGMMQCMPSGTGGFLDECNRILGYEKYTNEDLIRPSIQREIFEIVNGKHNPNKSILKAIALHNSRAKSSYKTAILEKYNELLEYYYKNENIFIVNEVID